MASPQTYWDNRDLRLIQMRDWEKRNREKRTDYFKKYRATKKGKENQAKAVEKYELNNELKRKAHIAVNNAIKLGKLKKKPCKKCGDLKVDGHHYLGYAEQFWLIVEWYCRKHHKEEHDKMIL